MRNFIKALTGAAGSAALAFPAVGSAQPKLILLGKTAEEFPPYRFVESLHSVALAKGDGSRVGFGSYDAENAWRTYVWTRSTGCIVSVPDIAANEFDICSPEGRPERIFCGISSTGAYIVGYSRSESNEGAYIWQYGTMHATDLLNIDSVSAARAAGVSTNGTLVATSGEIGANCWPSYTIGSRLNTVASAHTVMPTDAWNCDTHFPPAYVFANAITADGSTLAGSASIFTRCFDGFGARPLPWRWDVGSAPQLILLDSELQSGESFGISNDGETVVGFFYLGPREAAFRSTSGGTDAELLPDLAGSVSWSAAIDTSPNWIVGMTSLAGTFTATAWLGETTEPVDLNTRYACLKPQNLHLTAATSVSDNGRFVAGRAKYTGSGSVWAWIVDHGSCPADFNEDGFVDDADFVGFFNPAYQALVCPACDANCIGAGCEQPGVDDCTKFEDSIYSACIGDLNWDGIVDDVDFNIFVAAYNLTECPAD